MNQKMYIVAKHEYLKNIKKPAFWFTTLALPALMITVGLISGYSSNQAEKMAQEKISQAKQILVFDNSGLINKDSLAEPYKAIESVEKGIEQVKQEKATALFVYPDRLTNIKTITIYAQDPGLTQRTSFSKAAKELIKNHVLEELGELREVVESDLQVNALFFKEGQKVSLELSDILIPGAAMISYFLLTFLSSNFLLFSVSEEKENRMMEILLSILTPKQIIWGKIFGLSALAISQLIILVSLGLGGFKLLSLNLPTPIDQGLPAFNPGQILLSTFYAFNGFMLMAAIIVGAGSAMPSYREAQSFTSIFIILSIFPIYFASLIVSDPTGPIALFTSYFPFTAPLVLLARNALEALSTPEIILSLILLPIYVTGSFYLAFKLFELGSLEYNQKINFKNIFSNYKN